MELLTAYDRDGTAVKTAERTSLLAEIRAHSLKHGDAPWAVRAAMLLLVNRDGELYVVKRGEKPENPHRYDKTVGGHVTANETFSSALIRETREEIGVELIEVNQVIFPEVVGSVDTTRIAVVRPIDYLAWMRSERATSEGPTWIKRYQAMIYAGRFDGDLNFVDGEATGHQRLSLPALKQATAAAPHEYTFDLQWLIDRYGVFLDHSIR
jgi:ADP-ribose pyrophosphatase YjhB (NUDIX family)